jgi:hypothetical protein
MSIRSGQIRCHGCCYEGELQRRSVTLHYSLPDGTSAVGFRAFVWCRRCNSLRDAEQPIDAPALRAGIGALNPKRSLGAFFKGAVDRALGGTAEDTQAERQRLTALLMVAELRNSLPRCLTCGGTSINPVSFDEQGNSPAFTHDCGGHLYILPPDPDAPRFFYKPEIIPLDVEGNRLDKN